jgi:hypothetical protein
MLLGEPPEGPASGTRTSMSVAETEVDARRRGLVAVVTDDASNVRGARKILCQVFPWLIEMQDGAHLWNNVILEIVSCVSSFSEVSIRSVRLERR